MGQFVPVDVIGFLVIGKDEPSGRIRQLEVYVQIPMRTVDHLILEINRLTGLCVLVKAVSSSRGDYNSKLLLQSSDPLQEDRKQ